MTLEAWLELSDIFQPTLSSSGEKCKFNEPEIFHEFVLVSTNCLFREKTKTKTSLKTFCFFSLKRLLIKKCPFILFCNKNGQNQKCFNVVITKRMIWPETNLFFLIFSVHHTFWKCLAWGQPDTDFFLPTFPSDQWTKKNLSSSQLSSQHSLHGGSHSRRTLGDLDSWLLFLTLREACGLVIRGTLARGLDFVPVKIHLNLTYLYILRMLNRD